MSTYLGSVAQMPAPDRTTPRFLAPPPWVQRIRPALASLSDAWTALLDVDWPREADADHVVVGPGGVFVVKTLRWDGELSLADDVLRVGGRARARAVAAAKDATRTVVTTIPLLLPEDVHAVVCLESDQPVVGSVRGVLVCTTATLEQALDSFPEIFTPDHSALIALFVRNGLSTTGSGPAEPGRHAGTTGGWARRSRRRSSGRRRAA